jgi:hypothetical protein
MNSRLQNMIKKSDNGKSEDQNFKKSKKIKIMNTFTNYSIVH